MEIGAGVYLLLLKREKRGSGKPTGSLEGTLGLAMALTIPPEYFDWNRH